MIAFEMLPCDVQYANWQYITGKHTPEKLAYVVDLGRYEGLTMEEQEGLVQGAFRVELHMAILENTVPQLWRCHCRLQAVCGSSAACRLAAAGQYEPNLVLDDHRNGPAAVPYPSMDEADGNKMPG